MNLRSRKRICSWILLILCPLLLTCGCGSGKDNSGSQLLDAGSYSQSETATENDSMESNEAEGAGADEASGEDPGEKTEKTEETAAKPEPEINTEMLIYTCTLKIDTLDYETSVNTFRQMLHNAGGFVEKEKYTDGLSSQEYYIEDSEKTKSYKATVRVPQNQYETFLSGAGQLGDVRSKESNVENVNQEYTDLDTSLGIYEAKEKRYLKMLADITDDNHAISIEKELTELQIKIAQIKTRMKEIKTDVSYSTIKLTIREVGRYEETPEKTDTFMQRLGTTIKDTFKTFLLFMETLLFFIIRISPYAVIALLILLLVLFLQKRSKRKYSTEEVTEVAENPDDTENIENTGNTENAENIEDTTNIE